MQRTEPVATTRAAAVSPRFRLGRRAHKVALTAHVLASVGWFGGAVLVAFLVVTASATGDEVLARALYRSVETAVWLSVPLGVLAVVMGVVLGVGTTWGLLRYWWVVAKEAIAAAVVATDLLLVAPGAREALHGHLSRPLVEPAIIHCVVLAAATVLSVFKPAGRTPRGRRALAAGPDRRLAGVGRRSPPPARPTAPAGAYRRGDGEGGD